MPMTDVNVPNATSKDCKALAQDLAAAVMRWEGVSGIPLFKSSTAAFVLALRADAVSDESQLGEGSTFFFTLGGERDGIP
jgi:hypothetical protein